MRTTATTLTFCLLACACWGSGSSYIDRHFKDAHVDYSTGEPGEGWTRVMLQGTNVAWHNPTLAAGILVNSHCEGVKDSPLEALTGELMMGSTERELLSQTLKTFAKREALETMAIAKIDGVPRQRALFVLKKDGCVYDVVYDAAPLKFDEGLAAYRRVRDGLDVGARRDHS